MTGLLQLMLPLRLSWLISGTTMLAIWLTLMRYRKRNVVYFEPLVLEEHRKRPWGWRRKHVPIARDGLRVVAEAETGFTASTMVYSLSLVSGHTRWVLFKEYTYHRHHVRAVAQALAEELRCPFEDALDHPSIQRVDAPAFEGAPRDEVYLGVSEHGGRRVVITFLGAVLLLLLVMVLPDGGILPTLLMSLVPIAGLRWAWTSCPEPARPWSTLSRGRSSAGLALEGAQRGDLLL